MNMQDIKLTPSKEKICKLLNITNTEQLYQYYPFRYEFNYLMSFDKFKEDSRVCFKAKLVSFPRVFRYGNKSISHFDVLLDNNILKVSLYNRPWTKGYNIGNEIIIIGKFTKPNKVIAINVNLKADQQMLGIKPIYPTRNGISTNDIAKLIEKIYDKYKDEIIDLLPSDLINNHQIVSLNQAIKYIHFPKNKEEILQAYARLKYEEFLRFFLAVKLNSDNHISHKINKNIDNEKIKNFIQNLSFALTLDQQTTINEVLNDLSSNKVMYRLVQGDVGCGKTIVSAIAIYANYLAGYSSCLMAPTEILARQHFHYLQELYKPYQLKVGLLCQGIDSNIIKEQIKNGDFDVIVGTHSLFQDSVEFKRLGLVIADEQQRFGVKQRKKLQMKGENVDYLLMSATPIPRTLANAIYGEMATSNIKTMPSGRKGCLTKLIKENSIESIVPKLKETLSKNQQIYVITANIEESENYDAKDAISIYQELQSTFKDYQVGLMHGKLKNQEKEKVMQDFEENKIQILVSTTVVEVGVNVINATTMVIYDSDRFGMAQIHQLRGRVQRGNLKGSCYLLSKSEDEKALLRLNTLCETNDGFEIAFQDLKQRGPGDILGTRQSGLPALILGNLIEDEKIIKAAKEDVISIFNNLNKTEYLRFYHDILDNHLNKHID